MLHASAFAASTARKIVREGKNHRAMLISTRPGTKKLVMVEQANRDIKKNGGREARSSSKESHPGGSSVLVSGGRLRIDSDERYIGFSC